MCRRKATAQKALDDAAAAADAALAK